MQAGILNEVFLGGRADRGNVTDVFHHGRNGDGRHDQDGGEVELGKHELLQAYDLSGLHSFKVHISAAVGADDAAEGKDQHQCIGNDHAHEDGDDLDHALAPDVAADDD